MKKYSLFILLFFNILAGYSQVQQSQSLKLSREEIEALFLKNNLQLIAEKFNIDIADAAIAQARLWDNPTLSIEGMNLWSTKSQRDEIRDMATSSFVKNTEFSIELSQLILTANKRGKLIRREKVSKEIARQEFEKILRGLKAELRKSIYEIQYLQAYLNILMNQRQSVNQLVESHRKQVQQGNIAKSELLRLQSSLLDLENEINDTQLDLEEQRKTLKILLNIDPLTYIEVADDPDTVKNPDNIILSDLLYIADESRPDMKQYKLQTQYYQRSLDYEKSQRIPNINISASYDRYGGVWKDFVGFGISIDLPFFNRNQGNIKAAKLSLDQSQYLSQQQQSIIRHEIATAYNSYLHTYSFYKKIENNTLFSELDGMLDVYTKNLQYRNIGMLEYVDFMDTYKSSKQTMLTAKKNVSIQFEELQYTVGTEINKP